MFALDRSRHVLFYGDRVFLAAARRWAHEAPPLSAEPIDALGAMRWVQTESGHPLRAPVGVIGPNETGSDQLRAAEQVGDLLGRMRLTLLCGGRQGVMAAASRGAAAQGGLTIGLLPQSDPRAANPFVSVAIASGLGEARNAIIAQASACLIAVGDSHGTLSELALGLRMGKRVFGLAGAAALPEVVTIDDPVDLCLPLIMHLLGLESGEVPPSAG